MKNTVFVNGIVKSKEKYLIGKDRFFQMADAPDATEAFKLLTETGFGGEGFSDAAPSDYDKLIDAEYAALIGFLKEYAPDENFVKCVAARNDFFNAECAVRQKYLGACGAFVADGYFAREEFLKAANGEKNGLYQELNKVVKDACSLFENGKATGIAVSMLFFKAYYAFMLKNVKGAVWKENVVFEVDAKNICAAMRSLNEKAAETQYIDGGKVSKKTLALIVTGDEKKALDKLLATPYFELVKLGFSERTNGALVEFERRADSFATEQLKERRFETEGFVPLLVYVGYKLSEMKNVRLVMALKNCGADRESIIKRLVDCYAG